MFDKLKEILQKYSSLQEEMEKQETIADYEKYSVYLYNIKLSTRL